MWAPGIEKGVRAFAISLALAASVVGQAVAQDLTPLPPVQQAAPPSVTPKPLAPVKATTAKPAAPATAAAGGDAALRQRVEQLEEQIVDMQVVIGTLESLAKTSGSNTASPQAARNANAPSSGADAARVSSLEAQVQSLSQQVQQLQLSPSAAQPMSELPGRRSDTTGIAPPAAPVTAENGFGSTTVTADGADPIGGLIANAPLPPGATPSQLPPVVAGGAVVGQSLPPVAGVAGADTEGGDPKQLYETAYGSLLNQNYAAAQGGFESFLRLHPKDALAPDALFWLGESHYMQKNYSDAAEAFDLVASSYGASTKAPEAQLRRASTLVQLGRNDDACAALRQLTTKYPNARAVLKTKADAERQRAGCA
jgi:tol-pal system protein YbgF